MTNEKKISLIVACGMGNVIGKNGKIPWAGQLPSDMKRFKELTIGQSVVMGRKTWDSLPARFKPLPERQNIILTRNPQFSLDEKIAVIAYSLEEAVSIAHSRTVWIMGGEEIYRLALPKADHIHLTVVHGRFEGDTFFPTLDSKVWKILSSEHLQMGEKDCFDSTCFHLIRVIRV